jgi:hypothetical protein
MSSLPPIADIDRWFRNVRFGSKADMCSAKRHVRFTPESGQGNLDLRMQRTLKMTREVDNRRPQSARFVAGLVTVITTPQRAH